MAAFMFLSFWLVVNVNASVTNNSKVNNKKTEYSFANPDFAFPETVEKGAEKSLNTAIKGKNSVEALNAAIQVIVARNQISSSSFQGNVELIDSLGNLLPRPYNALSLLLQAGMYTQMYNTEQWTFNGRTLPLDSYPTDVKAWSGDLFAKKVLQLVGEALEYIDNAENIPISVISQLLDNKEGSDLTGLSVADFMASCAADQLRNFASVSAEKVIPFRTEGESELLSPKEECSRRASQIIDSRISFAENSGNPSELAFFIYKKSENLYGDDKKSFLSQWKDKLIDTPEGGMLLSLYFDAVNSNNFIGSEDSKALYHQMSRWLGSFQDSRFATAVKYDIEKLQQKNAYIDIPSNVYPGSEAMAKVTAVNVNKMYALIYKVSDDLLKNGSLVVNSFPGSSKCVAVIPLEFEGEPPFSAENRFEIPPLQSGNYVIILSASEKLSADWKNYVEKWSLQVFNVTDLSIISTSNSRMEDSGMVYVVDAMTQQPVEGAEVTCGDNNNKLVKSGITDKDGGFALPSGYFQITAKKDGNVATLWNRIYYSRQEDKKVDRANIFTDLSIYRQGDTVQFSLVGWSVFQEKCELKKGSDISIVLFDANSIEKDSLSLTTDEWGRCNGSFKLPADGLLGTYQLVAEYKDNPGKKVCRQTIEVAEYKTPSFYVEMEKDSTSSYLPGDIVKFKGIVKTYSGMPLAGVGVNYNVRWSPWWRFYSSSGSASYGGSLLTDGNGEFVVELPTENLKGTEFERGIYTLSVSATSDAGETQTAPNLRFSLGNVVSIRPQIEDKILVDSDSIKFNVPVYDMLDLPIAREVEYRVAPVSDPSRVMSGRFMSPSPVLESEKFPSGKYYFEFNIVGDTLKTGVKTIIFRKDDVKCPVVAPLWVPETQIVAKTGTRSVDVKVGCGYTGSYILCIVSDKNGIISRQWLSPSNEMIKVNVAAPTDNDKVWVTFSGMHDFKQQVSTVTVVSENSLRKMDVKTSVFRDKVSAGDKEEWKFIFSVDGNVQKDIPVFAVMSDKALNALVPFTWSFSNGISYRGNSTNVSVNNPGRFRTEAHFNKLPRYVEITNYSPDWNTYGYGLVSVAAPRMMLSRSVNDMVAEPTVESAAPRMYKAAANQAVPEISYEMVAVTSDSDSGESNFGESVRGGSTPKDIELRPVEMPLAFFMPNLNANKEGEVTVAFEVPNYNTTWQFQLFGYNEDLMSAGTLLDVEASKPVMVRSNPPRFVRTGDKMSVAASLFNNSDSDLCIEGQIELFDPLTNEVLCSEISNTENVAPSANRAINLQYKVPDNLSAIGIRAYAMTDNFSDGEQTVIPVLPSSTPIVESTQLYLKTGETDFSIRLPKFDKTANVTLKYCDNPIWECLLAMPSVATPDSKNIFSLVRSLFANSMSQSIVEKYPQVREGLSKVFSSNDTAVLTSNLQKDSDLKTVLLNNTPWVNDASAETERMRSLDQLLDKEKIDVSIKSLLQDLKNLQSANGGWSWCPDMRSSYFITRSVIAKLGIMKKAGCLSEDGVEMALKAISYCDETAYDNYMKNDKKYSVYDMLNYLYARSFFDNGQGKTGFRNLRKKALKEISEEWKNFSIHGKAIAAILLYRSEGYGSTASLILESLNQYASKDDAKGWWFDNLSSGFDGMPKLLTTATVLQAYNEINPDVEAIEGLRQWLVLQKEIENWGANPYTVEVLCAIMGSGTNWVATSSPATFRVDGKELNVDKEEMLTGIVTLNLDSSKISGKELSVTKHSAGPAWGGVISQYIAPIVDVKAESSPNLKIEKKLLVVSDSPAGQVAREGEIHVGDKVRVTLTLTCDKDMDYVAVIDERGAFLEPADQVSGYCAVDNLFLYKEVRDSRSSFFIGFLPKGVNVLTYDCYADREGEYSVGIASAQSQYSPLQTAHSSGECVTVTKAK